MALSLIAKVVSMVVILKPLCYGDLEPTFQHCCQLGTQVAAQAQRCAEVASGGPVAGVPPEQQSICLSTMQLCCVSTLRDIQCKEGKLTASKGLGCQSAKYDDSKYCCEACKLGMISGSMAMGCVFRHFTMGELWDETYQTCCTSILSPDKISEIPTPPPPAPPLDLAPSQSPRPMPSPSPRPKKHNSKQQITENICEILQGELCAHICVPMTGSTFLCECEPGFTLMADGKSCQQAKLINRCEASNPCQQRCTDTGVAIECSCLNGFILHSDNKTCVDVDECTKGLHDCTADQRCINELGTFSCSDEPKPTPVPLPTSTHLLSSTHRNPGSEGQTSDQSTATTSSHRDDSCPFGYIFNDVTQLCQDVDECEEELHVCGSNEICVNMPGGYRCTPSTQPPKCQPGYKYSAAQHNCIDIDECLEHDTPCDSNQICQNTVGSYSCQCRPGFELHSITRACVDINECQKNAHNCLNTQRCDNTIGSFQCVRYTNCGTGYTLNAQTGLCEDNDECAQNMCDHLGPGYKCRNTLGFFRCDKISSSSPTTETPSHSQPPSPTHHAHAVTLRCPRGYQLSSDKTCVDINECERGDVCKLNQVCLNIPGGYICSNKPSCEDGLRLEQGTNRCADIDECSEQPGICEQTCLNTWGSYRCVCRSGFTLSDDNRTCMDLNECELFKDRRLCAGYCINEPGSYSCQCPQGYRIGIDGVSCQDIDECSSSQTLCNGKDEVCLNMRGSHRCVSTACPPEYIKDSTHKNRCKRLTTNCREDDTECLEKPLTYSFHFITLASNLSTPLDLFTMRGPLWSSTTVNFKLTLDKVHTPPTVKPATLQTFNLHKPSHNVANIRMMEPLVGPQDIFLQLIMKFYYNNIYGGTTKSNIAIYVSQYDF